MLSGLAPRNIAPAARAGRLSGQFDYNVFSGEWLIGRIYERNGFPDEVRFGRYTASF
jgi:hypothetical protein